jgi:two-component system chemotaxis response regulator CheY
MKTLIVEDDFTSRLLLQEFLGIYGATHIAVNGREAMEAVRLSLESGAPYDLVCLDIRMPEMDGMEVLRQIRRHEELLSVDSAKASRIIMTTAVEDIKNVFDAYKNLCDGYLTKPIQKAKLLEKLREMKLIL